MKMEINILTNIKERRESNKWERENSSTTLTTISHIARIILFIFGYVFFKSNKYYTIQDTKIGSTKIIANISYKIKCNYILIIF